MKHFFVIIICFSADVAPLVYFEIIRFRFFRFLDGVSDPGLLHKVTRNYLGPNRKTRKETLVNVIIKIFKFFVDVFQSFEITIYSS